MKFLKFLPWIISIICLLIFLGFYFNKIPDKYIKGKEKIVEKIVVHKDTLKDTVVKYKFTTKFSTKDSIIRDTILKTVTIIKVKDSVNCFDFENNEKDGAHIGVSVCSKYFVPSMTDVSCEISYLPAPDTIRNIFRTDTIVKRRIAPYIAVGGICLGVGFIGGLGIAAKLAAKK